MLTTRSIIVDSEDWAKLKKLAQEKGVTISEIIRELVHNYVK